MAVRAPTTGYVKREGQYLTRSEIEQLASACTGAYADVVRVLALAGLRWGELAGLKVGDRVKVPGEGLRLQRTVMFGDRALASACTGVYADVVRVLGLAGLRWGELAGLQVGDRVPYPVRACGCNERSGERQGRRAVRRHVEGQAGQDGAAGRELVPVVESWRGASVGGLAVPVTAAADRSASPNWKRSVGWARRRCDRPADVAGSRPAAHLRLAVAGCRRRPQGGPAGPRARLGGHDDGPLRPPHRPEPVDLGEAGRGHHGGI